MFFFFFSSRSLRYLCRKIWYIKLTEFIFKTNDTKHDIDNDQRLTMPSIDAVSSVSQFHYSFELHKKLSEKKLPMSILFVDAPTKVAI